MKHASDLIPLVIIVGFATILHAATTITDQSIPTNWAVAKTATTASLKAEIPASLGELRYNQDDYDLYTATGTALGQWRNARTGDGP